MVLKVNVKSSPITKSLINDLEFNTTVKQCIEY